jgi:hypothetical protein
MRRTPILDEHFEETGRTAYDSLEPVAHAGIAVEDGGDPASIETRPVNSLEELRKLSELFFNRLGVTQRDVVRFQTRLLKYLTSSSSRRRDEYEKESWWKFIGGDSDRGYSPKMAQYLKDTPQALIAMNAEETDARSQGNIVCQLQLHYLKNQFDRSLNGPTTRVWIREWKRYLTRQGVRFFVGELGKLEWCRDELIPVTTVMSAWLEYSPPESQQPDPPPAGWQPLTATGKGNTPVDAPVPATPVPGVTHDHVLVEVLDNDDGEYAILISGRPYCFTARGHSREEIAECLARTINKSDPDVFAEVVSGTPGNPDAWPKGRTRIKLRHRTPDDGAVQLFGPPCDAVNLVITYSDGPTPREKPVRNVPIATLVLVKNNEEKEIHSILDNSAAARKVLEDWEQTRERAGLTSKSQQLLSALADAIGDMERPSAGKAKTPARATAKPSDLPKPLQPFAEQPAVAFFLQ